jgi:hypothetical protein
MTDEAKNAISNAEKARVAVLDAMSVSDAIAYVLIDHLQRATIEEYRVKESARKSEFVAAMAAKPEF